MDLTIVDYLAYLALALPLALWAAHALSRNGQVFLSDVFTGRPELARAVNNLLLVGFYLLTLGSVALLTTAGPAIGSARQMAEDLSVKIGIVAIVLGVTHMANVVVFHRFRSRALARPGEQPPVVPSAGR